MRSQKSKVKFVVIICCLLFTFYFSLFTCFAFAQTEEVKVMNINVKGNLLSVKLLNAEFGAVLNDIAQKAGFQVDIGSDAYSKRLSTDFEDVEIERGILRLLTLIREKNYSIHYDSKGFLSKLEVFGGAIIEKPQAGRQPIRPAVTQRPIPVRPPAPTLPRPLQPPAPPVIEEIEEIDNINDETIEQGTK
jgi:hypothetical protein